MNSTSNEWKTTTKYIVGVGIALFGLVLLFLSRPILPSLVIAALIAFLVRPLIFFFDVRLRFPRGLAVLITYLIAVLILLLLPMILIPSILSVVEFFIALDYQLLVTNLLDFAQTNLIFLQENGLQFLGFVINLDPLLAPLVESLEGFSPIVSPSLPSISTILDSLLSAVSLTFGVASDIISAFISLFFLIIASVYFSLDGHRFYTSFLGVLPNSVKSETSELVDRLKVIWDSFFRGQITLMVLIGMVVWLGGTLLGLPGAFALGVIAGLLEILPNLGPVLATIPAVIVALIQGSTVLAVNNLAFAFIVLIFYILIQMLENYLVVPRVLGDAVKLHPLVVISGVLVGAATWGILGALIAAPVIASTREIVRYLYYKILEEEEPQSITIAEEMEAAPEKGGVRGFLLRFFSRFGRKKDQVEKEELQETSAELALDDPPEIAGEE
ncbi:MAG: AI-2E family transporter [Anaerolineales bacterium]|nr:AI-2E family transporter [Anaerolineales bacterium]